MNLQDQIAARIRTLVPALYGVAVTWLVSRVPAVQDILAWLSTVLGEDVQQAIGFALTALAVYGWYVLARALGRRWPHLETFLLGSSLQPTYTPRLSPPSSDSSSSQ